jgi:hypothetical protein
LPQAVPYDRSVWRDAPRRAAEHPDHRSRDARAIFEYFRAEDLARLEDEVRQAVQRGDDDERERDETILF